MSEGSSATANDAQIGRSWRNYGRRRRSEEQDGMSVRCDQRYQMRSAAAVARIRVALGRWRAWPFLIWCCRSAVPVPRHLEDRRWTWQRSTSHEPGMADEEHSGRGRHHHRGIVLWPLAQRWDKASWQRRPWGNRARPVPDARFDRRRTMVQRRPLTLGGIATVILTVLWHSTHHADL